MMASQRTTLEIASLIFFTIFLTVLLVLVSITYNKVNNASSPHTTKTAGTESSPRTTNSAGTESPPETTSAVAEIVNIPYYGTMNTQQAWDNQLADSESVLYNETAHQYLNEITASLEPTYPNATVTVTGFSQITAAKSKLRGQGVSTDDGTVEVQFTTVIPTVKGTTPPTADDVPSTINSNINATGFDGCSVTIVMITTTSGTITARTTTTTPKQKTSNPSIGTITANTITPGTTKNPTKGNTSSSRDPDKVAADYLLSNMDRRYRPCEDFYKFACGNFTMNHPVKNNANGYGTFDLVQDRVGDIILDNMHKINLSDPDLSEWRSKTKRFYDSCKSRNQTGNKNNRQLLKYIDDFGGWPMIMEKGTWDEKKFDLAKVLATLTSTFGVQSLISADVDLDWKNPDSYLIQLDQASLALGNPEYYTHEKFHADRQAYVDMIKQSAAVLTYDQGLPKDDLRIKLAAQEILDFEVFLAEHIVSEDNRQSYFQMYNPEVVHTIQVNYSFMNWFIYFDTLLPHEVKHPFTGKANLVEIGYLKFLNKLVNDIRNATKMEVVANYLVWRLIFSLNVFMDDNLQKTVETFRVTASKSVSGSIFERDDECITLIINNLGFAASRLLIEGQLDENELNNKAVINMTAGLKNAFKGQLETLFWMDDRSKEVAYRKLDDYVELAGFPSWIENDNKMDTYYKDLEIFLDKKDFIQNYVSAMTFHETSRFRVLADTNVRRETWIMPPAIVNAWYQADFNSITFPSGILRPPFFKHDFPKAVNYGALGTVIGHEITHGSDDQGIQFNGTGYLETWMSLNSRIGFKRMVDCVIRQYNRTCFSEVDMCIDGIQTQGENTADNGGIREAYNAYQLYVLEHGEEAHLPGLEEFSMDQIFFLSFANVWCGDYETKEYLQQQLITNVHSPPPARVLNTLKNFGEFGKVWECEAGQPYYPFRSEACYVWTSPPTSNNTAYNRTAERLLSNMNETIHPCEDFFEYACGNYINEHPPPMGASSFISIDILQKEVFSQIIANLDNVTTTNAAISIQNAKTYFEICRRSNDTERVNNSEILDTIAKLGGWPAIDDSLDAKYDLTYISNLIGELASTYGVQTLLAASAVVDPGDTSRSVLAIDQSSLALGAQQYYLEAKLNNVFEEYQNLILNVTLALAKSKGVSIKYQDAFSAASSIANFEKKLAVIVRPNAVRRNYTNLYNLYNLIDTISSFPELDWPAYLHALAGFNNDLDIHFKQPNASIVISEPRFIQDLYNFMLDQLNEDSDVVQNYLVWRFIYARLNFMEDDIKQLYTNFRILKQGVKELPPAETDCVSQLATMLGYTVGRLYVDDWEMRGDDWLLDASGMIFNISSAFKETIAELDWMDIRSKEGAKNKINNMFTNPGYPEWIKDDTFLDDYYQDYKIDKTSTYFTVFNQLNQFSMFKALEAILEPVRRHDFQMSPAIVNAWYNPTLNSLTVPVAFLNPPFYNPEYPTAVKYGAIGAVMGHELTHAFDDSGIQFNGDGFLDLWMTQYSRDSYDTNVVGCVVNEYSHYCHFDGEFCIDGSRTQDENIADNGGIRQAFRAYRNHLREELRQDNHTELLLPGMEWYTQDQLFFLSYANLWCGYYSDEYVKRQILTDVHSPGMDRVRGVVQNFDEFSKAFQCKIGEPMDPEEKCYVWTDPIDTTEGYDKAAKGILESLDPLTKPCDDFFQYACGGWINRHPIPKHANSISTNSLTEDAVLLATTDAISNVDQNDDTIPDAFKKTQQMFDFCKEDISNQASTSFDSLQQFINEQLYNWPITTKFWAPTLGSTQEQIFDVAGKLGALGLSTIFDAYPQPNYEPNDGGETKYALYLDQANLLLGNREFYVNHMFADVMAKYKDILVQTAVKFAKKYNTHVPIQYIVSDAEEIIKFETTLARISLPDSLLENYTRQNNPFTKLGLRTAYPNIDFDTFFKTLLPDAINTPSNRFKIIVSEPSYLEAFNNHIPFMDIRVVQNYLVWRYIINSASLLGNDMRAILREFKQKTEFIEDLRDDISLCTQDTIALLPYAAGRLYVEKTVGENIGEIEIKVTKLVDSLVDQFKQRLRHLDWLDATSLENAEAKLVMLDKNIGFPSWSFNNTALDELYSLSINVSKDYYTTKREVSTWFYQTQFMVLDQSVDVHRKNFQSSPAIQNAWYQPWLNSLTIPAGIIQIPFFDSDYPSAVNYGGLGATAGHELTHGFDNDGVQFGPTGELNYWISPESAAYFNQNISQCVIDQYDQYCYNDLPSGKLCINGKVTQGENIADNGGTKTAYNAYLEWVGENGYEALLPGLESFTMDQIFFLNFARMWCEAIRPKALEQQLLLDVHSPARDRVIGTLSNMKEFHRSFNCKPGDKMYPSTMCDVW